MVRAQITQEQYRGSAEFCNAGGYIATAGTNMETITAEETGAKLHDEFASALAEDRALDREAGEKGEFLGP